MISKDCTITIDKGNASVDEDVYLYKNDMNIQILFTIVNNKYRYTKNTAIDNIIANNKASYAQVKFKKGDIEIDFEEQETKDGAVVLLIKKELIDEDTELGDYSIQIRLFDENKTSVITLPPVENCIHIQRPLFEKAGEDTNEDTNIVDQALTDMAVVTYAEPISATNSDGTYNKKTWISKEKITTAELNRMEEGISDVSSQCKDTDKKINDLTLDTLSSKVSTPELSTNKLKNPLRTLIREESLEINFQDLKVYVKSPYTYYMTEYGYIDARKKDGTKLDDIAIPSDAINDKIYKLYMLWFDPKARTLNFTLTTDVPADGVNFGLFYQGQPYLNNIGNGITVIDKNGKLVPTKLNDVKSSNIHHVTFYNNGASMEISYDTAKYTITAKSKKDVWLIFENSAINTKLDKTFTYQSTSARISYAYKLFVNMRDGTPYITPHDYELTDDEIQKYAFVCLFSKNVLFSPSFSANCILIDSKEPKLVNGFESNNSMAQAVFYSQGNNTMELNYDTVKNTITAISKKKNWILFESGGVYPDVDKTFTYQASNSNELTYVYKLFVHTKTGTPLITVYNYELTKDEIQNYAFVCSFAKSGLISPRFSSSCILMNGKVPNIINSSSKSNYDWTNNRFVLPSDLYLVKNIPYSISATDFNMEQIKDNDDCLFEITLPTKVVQFEQTAEIMIPYSYNHPFRTRLSGKYKYDNSILTQDINLHVADPSKITKKDIKVLCIGDSITQSNYPKHLKWHLEQMGINATMIGTVVDSHESYSYGISQYLDAEKGEGRGGWRLTDFTCTTPLINGGYYVDSSFPMMNPETGAFDFSYYMQQQGFSDVDFVIINLGTNDISGYHYAGSTSTNSAYNTIRKVDLNSEYLNSESEYYLGKLYKKLIDSIHTYNSNIKIAINPPMGAGDSTFIVSSMKWAEVCHYEFKDTTNVYTLASYASQAQISATNIERNRSDLVQVNPINNTYKMNYTPSDVHYNGMGQLIHTLYPASWIINMCK